MRSLTRPLAATALMAACYVSVPAVSVQAQSRSPGPSTSTPGLSDQNTAPDLSDQKLNAAAAALERVAALQNEYKERVAEAVAPVEKERLVSEANNQLTKAVTDQGLSVEEYVAILDVARGDPETRGKILRRIRPSDK
jgi:Domain of unknown function (DUF4168)